MPAQLFYKNDNVPSLCVHRQAIPLSLCAQAGNPRKHESLKKVKRVLALTRHRFQFAKRESSTFARNLDFFHKLLSNTNSLKYVRPPNHSNWGLPLHHKIISAKKVERLTCACFCVLIHTIN